MLINDRIKFKETEIGLIPEEWSLLPLSELAESVSDTFKFNDDAVIFLNTSDISEGKFLHNNRISPEGLPGQAKKRIKSGDILLSEIRPANRRYALVDFDSKDYVVSTKLMVIRAKNNVLPKYLYITLTSTDTLKKFQILAESRSGTFPQITFDAISSYYFIIPPEEEQKQIVEILCTLDDKIEINRKINENLEKLSNSLFKKWFVDIGEELPKGWEVKPLDEVANFLNGLALQKYPAENEIDYLPVIKIRELNSGITDTTDKASIKIPNEYIIKNGDIVFSWSGSLNVVIWCGGYGALNQHLFKVTSDRYSKWFYYLWVKFFLPTFQGIALDKAVTMGHIKRGHLTESKVLVPDDLTLLKMNTIMDPLIELLINNSIEIEKLIKIRNSILPRLMSGKIRVN